MIKFAYQSTMRSGSGQTFHVQWHFANVTAEVFDFPTAFGSSRWRVEPSDDLSIGEIPQVFPAKSIGFIEPWQLGTHICGSVDQWQNGWPLGTPAADPNCCLFAGEFNDDFDDDFLT